MDYITKRSFLFSSLVFITSCFHFKPWEMSSSSSSISDDSTSSSSDEDLLWVKMTLSFFRWWQQSLPTLMICSIHMTWKKGGGQSINPTLGVGVQDVLGTMRATLPLFKTLTNFTLTKFDELASHVLPTIKAHFRSICELFCSYFMFSVLIF